MQPLKGKVALVAGATRGAGRGMAVELGAAGATVYCTGRSTRTNRSPLNRPETIEETAERVTEQGGKGIHVQVDHTDTEQVKSLFDRIDKEQKGQLDILINDIWGGDDLTDFNTPFWEHNLENGMQMLKQAVHAHIITSHYGAPLMVKRKSGLIIEITDGATLTYRESCGLFYDLSKVSAIRLALSMAEDLKPYNITALALTPGFLRSEAMLEHFGVTEQNWKDAVENAPTFIASETPHYIGRAVVGLATDPNVFQKTGQAFATWDLFKEYNFTDIDGTQPDWGTFYDAYQKQKDN